MVKKLTKFDYNKTTKPDKLICIQIVLRTINRKMLWKYLKNVRIFFRGGGVRGTKKKKKKVVRLDKNTKTNKIIW